MTKRNQVLMCIALAAVTVIVILASRSSSPDYPPVVAPASLYSDSQLPDLASAADVAEKKATFFGFVLPLVETENQRIALIRQELETFAALAELNDDQRLWLDDVALHYRIKNGSESHQQLISVLLRRVDTVPPSLALAQSANESAWGVSRFARKGNNLFGQWCFKRGCGLVPSSRNEGAVHEVAVFDNPGKSVESYIHNLNSNAAYQEFRKERKQQREQNRLLSGSVLAGGLLMYSARGSEYVDELRAMIKTNGLSQYDTF